MKTRFRVTALEGGRFRIWNQACISPKDSAAKAFTPSPPIGTSSPSKQETTKLKHTLDFINQIFFLKKKITKELWNMCAAKEGLWQWVMGSLGQKGLWWARYSGDPKPPPMGGWAVLGHGLRAPLRTLRSWATQAAVQEARVCVNGAEC